MRFLLLALALSAAPVLAQDGMTVTMTTDKAVYDYGETILITIDVTNRGEVEQWIGGSSSCRTMYRIDDFDVYDFVSCTLDDTPVLYRPGWTRRWVWEADPAIFGIPLVEGTTHTVTGYHLRVDGEPATTIEAPAFVGGFVYVKWPSTLPPEQIQPVRDSLNAETVYQFGSETEVWRIEGTLVDDAVAHYQGDPRFLSFWRWDLVDPAWGVFVVTTSSDTMPSGDAVRVEAGPNPFAGALTVTVTPPQTEAVRVEVFDLQGRRVATLQDGVLEGQVPHQITWQPSRLGNGTYLVQVSGASFATTRRVTFRR